MSIALVTSVAAAGVSSGATTTAAIDTSGVNFLFAVTAGLTFTSFTDSKSNTWTALTTRAPGSTFTLRTFYVATPTVGSGHTFTYTPSSTGFAPVLVGGFSGVNATPFDQENGATGLLIDTLQTGSVTPSENNEVLLTGFANDSTSGTFAINSSFQILQSIAGDGVNTYGAALAYQFQTTATARNPTWDPGVEKRNLAAEIATFKQAAAGAAVRHLLPLLGVG